VGGRHHLQLGPFNAPAERNTPRAPLSISVKATWP